MVSYRVTLARSASKELESLRSALVAKLFSKIENLSENPRPVGCKKLKGFKNLWRLRVGEYRIIYSVDDQKKNVDVTAVRHRREVYR